VLFSTLNVAWLFQEGWLGRTLAEFLSDERLRFDEAYIRTLGIFLGLWDIEPDELLAVAPPGTLQQLALAPVLIAAVRIHALHAILCNGQAPSERFNEADRLLYLAAVPEAARRATRSWHALVDLSEDSNNDRAEEFMRHTLLQPSGRTIPRYLELLFQAYLHGQSAVCVILCRCIIEQFVKRASDSRDESRPGGSSGAETIMQRLASLRGSGAIDATRYRQAADVWARGNKVVHQDPDHIRDAWDTITMTLEVVRYFEERSTRI
jgi:hypothetical protein